MEMSAALHTHNALIKAGVDAQLHLWDGLGHGFFNLYPDIEESRDALNVIVQFFNKHLGVDK
jgi:acetyl esterase/lipase